MRQTILQQLKEFHLSIYLMGVLGGIIVGFVLGTASAKADEIPPLQAPTAYVTIGALVATCQSEEVTQRALCLGYFMGVVETLNEQNIGVCAPTNEQGVTIVASNMYKRLVNVLLSVPPENVALILDEPVLPLLVSVARGLWNCTNV